MTNLMQTTMVMLNLMMIECMLEIKENEGKSLVYYLKQVQSRG